MILLGGAIALLALVLPGAALIRREEWERADPIELAALAFSEIRHFGAGTPVVARRLVTMAAGVGRRLDGDRRAILVREARHVVRAASASIEDPEDRAEIIALGRDALGSDE